MLGGRGFAVGDRGVWGRGMGIGEEEGKSDYYVYINILFSQLNSLFSVQVKCRILGLEEWRWSIILRRDID